ncbi:hypothetical protein PGT21_014571 [Puccinia graminis f. sp. tritici]|uniref:Uncharacterized protein n=1 Tax=Puccinia graminis f. sp. tritici TaxID=56615 RepID=A0A5B0MK71_PUCGR|nr:hypothetical protein PGT21_014571 [Puccinia graminis f. sp. tritici]KAA1126817.1 hypothetical protein PGTUg99_024344 [Puccinia graminis f. sp. tritici]
MKYDIRASKDGATAANNAFTERISLLDQTNRERLFNPFFQVPDTPVEVLHVFLLGIVKYLVRDLMGRMKPAQLDLIEGRYRAFNLAGLNIPWLSPHYMAKHSSNFVGKEFKAVLQSAPFVLFEFMDDPERQAWIALCQLAPLVFQTHIDEMRPYLALLRFHIEKFLYYVIKITAQWVNKPKFHMLLHLPDSIERFGSASLYATEKFESYNGTLRKAAVHSNRQSPGKDIANSFASYKCIRHLTCGGAFKDPKDSTRYITAAPSVANMFMERHSFQKSMDYNFLAHTELKGHFPRVINSKVTAPTKLPSGLRMHLPGRRISQLEAIQWTAHRVLKRGVYVMVRSGGVLGGTALTIGCVDHVWEARFRGRVSFWVCYTEYSRGGVDPYYQMRSIRKSKTHKYVHIEGVESTINIQHNCHAGGCQVSPTGQILIEREESKENNVIVVHEDTGEYIVNSGELNGRKVLRDWVDVPRGEEDIRDVIPTLKKGLATWVQAASGSEEDEDLDDPSH